MVIKYEQLLIQKDKKLEKKYIYIYINLLTICFDENPSLRSRTRNDYVEELEYDRKHPILQKDSHFTNAQFVSCRF